MPGILKSDRYRSNGRHTNDRPSQKTATGIEGLDEITLGGLPRGRATMLLGDAGSGKTVLAMQMLVNGARRGEPGIFVAFEESSKQILLNMSQFGWDLPGLIRRKQLFILDAQLTHDVVKAGEFDLGGLLAAISAKTAEIGAQRIVFDALDIPLLLLEHTIAERREVYRIRDWLQENGLTGILTAKRENGSTHGDRYGFMQFMVDCVILLEHRATDDRFLRTLRVLKYRGSGFYENDFPFVVSSQGIEVAVVHGGELSYDAPTQRISTGIGRLDAMLGGGYFRGSSTLISGAPGTAKTTLAGAFLDAACRRGEHALFVSFDEGAEQILRNLASVNIRLEPHARSGKLKFYCTRAEVRGAEEHFLIIKQLITEHKPTVAAIDPLSALLRASAHHATIGVTQRLLDLFKAKGITLACSSMVTPEEAHREHTDLMISTLADTWIHLSFAIHGGERNRVLTVVKSRGTAHSNQVRELILNQSGVTLADVYSAGGEVLMGTMRWERERTKLQERERQEVRTRQRQVELELELSVAAGELEAMRRKLEAKRAELGLLMESAQARERDWTQYSEEIGERRGTDKTENGDSRKQQKGRPLKISTAPRLSTRTARSGAEE